jgi:hypothetical protein
MKKLILTVAMALGTVVATQAQEAKVSGTKRPIKENAQKQSPDERASSQAAKAQKELGLNEEQKIKYEYAARERAMANSEIREKMKGSTTPEERAQLHAQKKANNKTFESNISAFLYQMHLYYSPKII